MQWLILTIKKRNLGTHKPIINGDNLMKKTLLTIRTGLNEFKKRWNLVK